MFQQTASVGSKKASSYPEDVEEPESESQNTEVRAEWNVPQVPPYEPSKNQSEIKAVKGHKIRDQSQKASRNKGLRDR
jgi:hypothetical protein